MPHLARTLYALLLASLAWVGLSPASAQVQQAGSPQTRAAGTRPAQAAKPSAASPATNLMLHVDPAATQIHFTVGSLVRNVRGSFQFKGGALALDPDSTLAQGELLVDATTVHTGSAAEDKRIQDEVLESARYPSIFFHAEHRRGELPKSNGEADILLDGSLNIHGADHPMQMRVHVVRQGDALTATTRFLVPYVDWGMKQPHSTLFRLSRQAVVDVTAKGTIRTVPTVNGTQSNDSDEEKPSDARPR
jgi:polyisoprenoid-binding protein YceI